MSVNQSENTIEASKERKQSFTIVINGQQETVHENHLTYEQVVRLACPEGPFDILYSITYANPKGDDGSLAMGQKVKIKDGMCFNVIKTNRS
jgi:hypothetical protein